VIERFFLNLKIKRVSQKDYANHAEAINDIADYIVNFYNAVRLHSALGNSEKSSRTSCCDMPLENINNTSYTVMRRLRIQGLPARFPGSSVVLLVACS
jgi:transposase InsO family protein